jgi:hypothetical protein
LQTGAEIYKTSAGQSYSIDNFKYYISNIRLKRKESQIAFANNYFLITEEDSLSQTITLAVEEGKYDSLVFLVGVDSLHNCSGAQSGALDPVNGMFWAWNSGYIFLKLEGKSAASPERGHLFEYHIGGYKAGQNAMREISLPLSSLKIAESKTNIIRVEVDIAKLFEGPESIDIAKTPVVADPGQRAVMIAENYKKMFSIQK